MNTLMQPFLKDAYLPTCLNTCTHASIHLYKSKLAHFKPKCSGSEVVSPLGTQFFFQLIISRDSAPSGT